MSRSYITFTEVPRQTEHIQRPETFGQSIIRIGFLLSYSGLFLLLFLISSFSSLARHLHLELARFFSRLYHPIFSYYYLNVA